MVIFNELYRNYYETWNGQLTEPDFYNVVIDYHLYDWQEPYTYESVQSHIRDAQSFGRLIDKFAPQHPVIVAEWSMSTGLEVKAGQPFVNACLKSFQQGLGYYLWTWKVERGWGYDDWDLQYQSYVQNGFTLHANQGLL
jgi:glucan 1,3-beta-glucosidase